jgi:hypothetical protein
MSQTRDHRLIRVDRVRLRIFEGVCATTYPRCAGSLTLVSDRQFGTNTSGAFLINFGAQINGPRGYMVADWNGSFRDPRTGTSYAFGDQEEGAFG